MQGLFRKIEYDINKRYRIILRKIETQTDRSPDCFWLRVLAARSNNMFGVRQTDDGTTPKSTRWNIYRAALSTMRGDQLTWQVTRAECAPTSYEPRSGSAQCSPIWNTEDFRSKLDTTRGGRLRGCSWHVSFAFKQQHAQNLDPIFIVQDQFKESH